MHKWKIVYTKQAQKDAKKLFSAGLKNKAETLLDILKKNPFSKPPPYEKLVGDLAGAYSSENKHSASSCLSGLRKGKGSKDYQNVDTLRVRNS